ncbi:MAG: glycosyltransferase [Patescibacteria group bacterium]
MKIVILNHNPKERGTYFRCLGFARELVKLNHSVTFFCLSSKKNKLAIKYQELGIDFVELPFYFNGGILGLWEHFYRGFYIFFYLLLKKIDIVHSFNVASPTVGLATVLIFLTKKIKKIKLVVDWDDWWGKGGLTTLNNQGKLQEAVADFLETKIPRLADQVTLHNELIKTRSINCGVAPEKITKIYNGCDWDSYKNFYENGYTQEKARQELVLPMDKKILFFGGAIVTSVPFLLSVLKQIQDNNVIMVIIGPRNDGFEKMAEEFGLKERVIFKNPVAYDLFKKHTLAADVLLFPRSNNSLLDKCTFPGRIGDYFLASRPTVSSDVGELSIVFREEDVGFLAKADDADDFASKVKEALQNNGRSFSLSKNALELGQGKYSWKNLTAVLISQVYLNSVKKDQEKMTVKTILYNFYDFKEKVRQMNEINPDAYLQSLIYMLSSKMYIESVANDLLFLHNKATNKNNILDFGTGSGFIPQVLANDFFEIVGLDTFEREYSIEFAREKAESVRLQKEWDESSSDKNELYYWLMSQHKNIKLNLTDGKSVPYENDYFENICAYAVVEHLSDDVAEKTLCELNRVTKKDGRIFIFKLPQKYSWSEFVARKLKLGAHSKLLTKIEITQLLTRTGWQVEEIDYSDFVFEFPPKVANFLYYPLKFLNFIIAYTPLKFLGHNFKIVARKNN